VGAADGAELRGVVLGLEEVGDDPGLREAVDLRDRRRERALSASRSSRRIVSEALTHVRTEETSNRRASIARTMRRQTVGTQKTNVARSRSIASRTSTGSGRSSTTTVAPTRKSGTRTQSAPPCGTAGRSGAAVALGDLKLVHVDQRVQVVLAVESVAPSGSPWSRSCT